MRKNLNLSLYIRGGVGVVRRNPIVLVPMLIAIILVVIVSLVMRQLALGFAGGFLNLVIMAALCIYAQGVTVAMAWDAHNRGSTSLDVGALIARRAASRLLPLSLIIGLLFSGGLLLVLVPGFIVLLFSMFAMPLVIVKNLSVFEALTESVKLVRNEFRSAMLMFVMLSFAGLMLFMAAAIFKEAIPFVGVVVSMGLWGVFIATASVIVLELYLELNN
jgi:hypothetical protein